MGLKNDLRVALNKAVKAGDTAGAVAIQAQIDRLVTARGNAAAGLNTPGFASIPSTFTVSSQFNNVFSIAGLIYGNQRAAFDIIAANPNVFTYNPSKGTYDANLRAGQTLNLPQGAVGNANVPSNVGFIEAGGNVKTFGTGAATAPPTTPPSVGTGVDELTRTFRNLEAATGQTPSPAQVLADPTGSFTGGGRFNTSTARIQPPAGIDAGPTGSFVGAGGTRFQAGANAVPSQATGSFTAAGGRAFNKTGVQISPQSIARDFLNSIIPASTSSKDPLGSFTGGGGNKVNLAVEQTTLTGGADLGFLGAQLADAVAGTGAWPRGMRNEVRMQLGITHTDMIGSGYVLFPDGTYWFQGLPEGTTSEFSSPGAFFIPTFGYQRSGKGTGRRRGSSRGEGERGRSGGGYARWNIGFG